MEIVLHHANRAESATCQAFGELDAVLAILTHRDGVMVIAVAAVNLGLVAQRFHQLVASGHGAG